MIKRSFIRYFSIIVIISAFGLVTGCGSGKKEGASEPLAEPARVGSESCVNTCHADTRDVTDTKISKAWAATTHTTVENVQCEDCHGAAGEHWGVGPIPFPTPQSGRCLTCHDGSRAEDKSAFLQTAHANTHVPGGPFGPDMFFFQGDALNSGASTIEGVPEFFPDGVTPVTHAEHIEECSRCHNPNQRFEYANGDTSGELVKPDPNDMPNPAPGCAGCHAAHETQQMVQIPQRSEAVGYPLFRKFFIGASGAQVDLTDPAGSFIRGAIFQPNGAAMGGTVSGKNNELSVEVMCGSCHTKGKYKYSQLQTHQENVFPQWKNSGHGERNDPAFAEFSANPPAYTNPDTGIPYDVGSHSPSYPVDMALSTFGAVANTTQNAGSNIFACFHCHNGIGSIVWQEDAQGRPDADVVFGDEPVTCITCHETHEQPEGTSHLIRVPVAITQYSGEIEIKGNVFLDNTPVPVDKAGDGIICIFCHQGRESGLTLYAARLAPGKEVAGRSFFNPHYLGTAAMLWGVNAYEYAGQSYSANAAHQEANCPTCHMANPTDDNRNGGHTWWPNVATCNTSGCHGSASLGAIAADPASENGPASPDVDNYRALFDTNNYTGDPGGASLSIANSIRVLEDKIINLLAAQGAFYDDLHYPYFFNTPDVSQHTNANAFTAWTPALYRAAFNLSYIIKGLPSGAESQIDAPNASAAVHDYKYIIQLLLDGYEDLTGAPLAGANRPAGTRPATVYGPGQ
jgi:hypothetical protein